MKHNRKSATPKPAPLVTQAELDAILNAPRQTSAWVTAVCAAREVTSLSNWDVLTIASEDPAPNPASAIASLIEGLRIRHAGDRTTLAALAAIEEYHLSNALDVARGA